LVEELDELDDFAYEDEDDDFGYDRQKKRYGSYDKGEE
jgi:hypothetical protein